MKLFGQSRRAGAERLTSNVLRIGDGSTSFNGAVTIPANRTGQALVDESAREVKFDAS
jgi:hypothetical protein